MNNKSKKLITKKDHTVHMREILTKQQEARDLSIVNCQIAQELIMQSVKGAKNSLVSIEALKCQVKVV